ncbi:MAG TPA: sigma-70 family RNA polymerase sigma factor [Phycisphaerae bacterium]|nr:sigma-70 family RNA polymerase sigma factor [Phycisphaerae bacterium]HRW51318.1 sigma-70 family RNA polymerase sigma factor [Phycisphaerae bacterium]
MSEADDTPNEPQPAATALIEVVYQELRRLAAEYLQRERPDHTLQPTALVHEAYVRLSELDRIEWRDRTHFYAAAAGAIRRVLVDHARRRKAAKRGGGWRQITLSGLGSDADAPEIDVLALDEALGKLAALDERKARVVELRFFAGMTIDETARSLGVGTTTVEDDWAFAKSWLRRALGDDVEGQQHNPS